MSRPAAALALTAPLVTASFGGDTDLLLPTAALCSVATAMVAFWRPTAAALAELTAPPPVVPVHG
jgi:hypothetical protein